MTCVLLILLSSFYRHLNQDNWNDISKLAAAMESQCKESNKMFEKLQAKSASSGGENSQRRRLLDTMEDLQHLSYFL